MCVICMAAKKRHMHREEVQEAMRSNDAGFFMCALRPDGTRETIRTLDQKEALKFWDETVKDDDAFVMHARIPSRGPKTLENVHGWEEDGILFMHNMTITDIDDMMKRAKWSGTDSEFFFRKIFIPYYRGCGDEAYKDGKFCDDLNNLITHFVGYSNKFCFIMPDNTVIRYGSWVNEPDRKEGDKVAFWASNSSYKVFPTRGKGGGAANAAGFRSPYYDDLPGYYDSYYGYYGYYERQNKKRKQQPQQQQQPKVSYQQPTTPAAAAAAPAAVTKKETAFDGETLLNMAGVEELCRLAITHLVYENAIICRYIYSEAEAETEVEKVLRASFPAPFRDTFDQVKDAFLSLASYDDLGLDSAAVKKYVRRFALKVAAIYEEKLTKIKSPYAVFPSEWALRMGLKETQDKIRILGRLMNVEMFFQGMAEEVAVAYVMSKDGEQVEVCQIEDLIGLDELKVDAAPDAVQMLLSVINDTVVRDYDGDPEADKPEDAKEAEDDIGDDDALEIRGFADGDVALDPDADVETDVDTYDNDSSAATLPAAARTPDDDLTDMDPETREALERCNALPHLGAAEEEEPADGDNPAGAA